MNRQFESDALPGKPRILFVGLSENSHTQSWIDLLQGAPFNVRLFAMPTGIPPSDWDVPTYVSAYTSESMNPRTRRNLYPSWQGGQLTKRAVARLILGGNGADSLRARWLAKVIRQWQPDIIHTLGMTQGGEFYLNVRRRFGLAGIGKWVLQTRGGSDLIPAYLDPNRRAELTEILRACDQLICDNVENLRIARELGVREDQFAPIAPVPGTGGVDVDLMRRNWRGRPSSRRVIVLPKTYDSPWVKMLPAFEAIKSCWERIQPCEIHMLSMNPESFMWFWTLPESIRASCHTYERIPRSQVLHLMSAARVMLAPSLSDGVPNSMYEGMAAGALPIVSPLETILPVVNSEENVLFARNLYPDEIAAALERAMTDDELVDAAAERNLALLRRVADRSVIGPRVIEFYQGLTGEQGAS